MIPKKIYGYCPISWLPMRATASHRSEMVNQILFGETFRILDTEGEWYLVETDFDQYRGYIAVNSFCHISADTWMEMQQDFALATTFTTILHRRYGISFAIPPTSRLPFLRQKKILVEGNEYLLSNIPQPVSLRESIIPYLHAPYLWGGRTPWGTDCSGFTQALYNIQSVKLPRDASQQAGIGTEITPQEAQFGDLAFFSNEQGKITHVGMIYDAHSIVHASGRVRMDDWDSKGIFCRDLNSYSHTLHSIKRLMPKSKIG